MAEESQLNSRDISKSQERKKGSWEGDCHCLEDKKIKFEPVSEAEFNEIQSVLDMAEDLLPKLSAVLRKLKVMEKKLQKLDHLESYVKSLNEKIKRDKQEKRHVQNHKSFGQRNRQKNGVSQQRG